MSDCPNSDQAHRRRIAQRDLRAFAERIASKPLPTENLRSTWNPPDWEDIVEWWDEAVKDARKLTGGSYR